MPAKPPLDIRDAHREEHSTVNEPALDPEHASWRDMYQVHPCADVFPMMTDVEIDGLAKDIHEHGLHEPVTLWHDGARQYLLDGRNRLEALTRRGVEITPEQIREYTASEIDPAAYVISKNLRRRHLTKKQQAILIVKAIEAAKRTDEAKLAPSVTRRDDGRLSGSTKDPDLAAAVLEGHKAGIGARTIRRAREEALGSSTSKRRKAKASDALLSTPSTRSAQPLRTEDVLVEVKSAIERAVSRWPPDANLQPLIDHLRDAASRLAERGPDHEQESGTS